MQSEDTPHSEVTRPQVPGSNAGGSGSQPSPRERRTKAASIIQPASLVPLSGAVDVVASNSSDPLAQGWKVISRGTNWEKWAEDLPRSDSGPASGWHDVRRQVVDGLTDRSKSICYCVHPDIPLTRFAMDWKGRQRDRRGWRNDTSPRTFLLELQTFSLTNPSRRRNTVKNVWRAKTVREAARVPDAQSTDAWCDGLAADMAQAWGEVLHREGTSKEIRALRKTLPPPSGDTVKEFFRTWATTADVRPEEHLPASSDGNEPEAGPSEPRALFPPPVSQTHLKPEAEREKPWRVSRDWLDRVQGILQRPTSPPTPDCPEPPIDHDKWEIIRGTSEWSDKVYEPSMDEIDDFTREKSWCRSEEVAKEGSNCVLDAKSPTITYLWYRSVPSVKWAIDRVQLSWLTEGIGRMLRVELQFAACKPGHDVSWESAQSFSVSLEGDDPDVVMRNFKTAMEFTLSAGWYHSDMHVGQREHCRRMTTHFPPDPTVTRFAAAWANIDFDDPLGEQTSNQSVAPAYSTAAPSSGGMPPPPPPGAILYGQQLPMANAISPSFAPTAPSSASVTPPGQMPYSQWRAMMDAASSLHAPTTPTTPSFARPAPSFSGHRFPAPVPRPGGSRPPQGLTIAPAPGGREMWPHMALASETGGHGAVQSSRPALPIPPTVPSSTAQSSAQRPRSLADTSRELLKLQSQLLTEDEEGERGRQGRG